MTSAVFFERVCLIGIGLIGASLARVLRRDGLAGHIVGCARTAKTRETALALGLVDSVHETPAAAARDADLVVICTPIGSYGAIGAAIAGALKPGAIVSDVGSVKQAAIAALAPHIPPGVTFVPAHPVAGTEQSGPEAGFAELFATRWCILTPEAETDPTAVARVSALWQQAGMTVAMMAADHHDRVMAITSHVPHLIAFTIVGTATDLEDVLQGEVVKFSAAGFRDFTRIAASDPIMWRDIFLNNRAAVLDALGRLTEDLATLQRAIRNGDGATLEAQFSRTRALRRAIVEAKQD